MEKKWQRIKFMPATPAGPNGKRLTGCAEHIELSRRAATEGMVLLKNSCGLLPFARGQQLAVFGKAQSDYVKGGGGSGDVTVAYVRSLLEGLRIKEQEGKVSLFAPLSRYYEDYVAAQYKEGREPGLMQEPVLPADLLAQAREATDTALITISRFSGEGWDRSGTAHDGDFYLSETEQAMVDQVAAAFPRVAVVLNTGGMMDTSWFIDSENISAALLGWQAGMEGGLATADLLVGDVCPSGHLTDTFARAFADYPSSETFNESEKYVTYDEDIFVGYRYFETIPGAAEKVCYPFGFGLSYTTFAVSDVHCAIAENGQYRVTARVTNTGKCAGKQVLQLYVEAPQGKLGKAARSLCGFRKTGLLAPGAFEDVSISVDPYTFASYDDEGAVALSAWVLEKGEYRFHLGDNVRDTQQLPLAYVVEEDRVLEQVASHCAPHHLPRRLRADGTYSPVAMDDQIPDWDFDPAGLPPEGKLPDEAPVYRKAEVQLMDVHEGKVTLDAFLETLTDEDLAIMLGGQPNRGVANTFGWGNIQHRGVPNAMTADGPAGLRIRPECGVHTTAFPCSTLLCCTWDPAVVESVGAAGAAEVYETGIGIWLTPAINIHRTPLCGRNFEYYSEDPFLAGKLASAMIRGIQSQGVAASLKHFACNNKEVNRRQSDSRLSERALREIYIKAFEICVKEASPWSIMSSYNLINGERASTNKGLLTHILRGEWGFDGVVTTDWFALSEQWKEITCGNDVKMGVGTPDLTLAHLRSGKLPREDALRSARRLLQLILRLR